MKQVLSIRLSVLCLLLSCLAPVAITAQAADPLFALQRGYRTGYSDGYMAGYRDTIDTVSRNYTRHKEYAKADRAFNTEYGTLADYRDGYQQGFEAGYDTGFDRRSFDANLPKALGRRGAINADSQNMASAVTKPADPQQAVIKTDPITTRSDDQDNKSTSPQDAVKQIQASYGSTIVIPRETELILEMETDLNTEQSREGDKFIARITAPSEIAGATVEGRVSKVVRPGRIKRHSELLLTFDRIIINDSRWSNFSAQLIEVMPVKGDNIRRVDEEGTAIGQSSLKSDAVKVGGATGAGLITGAIIGGPIGAGVGAGVGAAFGVGAVVIERGKHVRLNRNQQVRIRTAYETRIR
jgi:hypothetical protein